MVFLIAIVIVPLMIIIGAFHYISSGGSPEKIKIAKNIMMYSIVGLLIVLFAKGIISVLEYLLRGP
jgi:hypothetical protein